MEASLLLMSETKNSMRRSWLNAHLKGAGRIYQQAFIEIFYFYNRQQKQERLDYLSPAEFT